MARFILFTALPHVQLCTRDWCCKTVRDHSQHDTAQHNETAYLQRPTWKKNKLHFLDDSKRIQQCVHRSSQTVVHNEKKGGLAASAPRKIQFFISSSAARAKFTSICNHNKFKKTCLLMNRTAPLLSLADAQPRRNMCDFLQPIHPVKLQKQMRSVAEDWGI